MPETAVYQFTWWDRHAGKDNISPRFATLQAITAYSGHEGPSFRLMPDQHSG
jgi:hypothetical protein